MNGRVLEKHVEKAIVEYLTLDGWICRKQEQNYSEKKRKTVGEAGMPDQLCVRYPICGNWTPGNRADAAVMWIEMKRERGGTGKRALYTKAEKAKIHQQAWHAAERRRGALTLIAGEDFPATIEGFVAWYRKSGLQRNAGLRMGGAAA